MTQEIINVGTAPNDGLGDPIRTAFQKTNNNFSQLFSLEANSISNGTSNVRIPSANANIYASVANVANVVTITTTGLQTIGLNTTGAAVIGGNLTVFGNISANGGINVISGNSGQFFGNIATGFGALYAGIPSGYGNLAQVVLQVAADFDGYSQIEFQNTSNGTSASADYVATGDIGTDFSYFVNMGFASSTFDGTGNNVFGNSVLPSDGYLYAQGDLGNVTAGGNLVIGTNTVDRVVKFVVGGGNTDNIAVTFNAPNTAANSTTTGTVTVAGDMGIAGNVYFDYAIGNGSLLTGIDATTIQNGTSNVQVYANGNVAVSIAGTANTTVFTQAGVSAPQVTATAGVVYNSNTITGNNVVGTGLNGLSVGPLSMVNGATMSLPSGQRWLVM